MDDSANLLKNPIAKSMQLPFKARLSPIRFSLRTFLIFITLVCVYVACWKATSDFENAQLPRNTMYWQVVERSIPFAFVIVETEAVVRSQTGAERRFYFWFFTKRKFEFYSYPVDPSPYGIHFFPRGEEFKLQREAETLDAYRSEQQE